MGKPIQRTGCNRDTFGGFPEYRFVQRYLEGHAQGNAPKRSAIDSPSEIILNWAI